MQNNILDKPKLILNRNKIIKIIIKLINTLINLKDQKNYFLLKLKDGRIINTKSWKGWEWTHGIALYSLYNFYKLNNNKIILNIINKWFNYHFHKEIPTKNINTFSPLLTLAYIYEQNKNISLLPILETWSEWILNTLPRTKNMAFQHIVFNNINKGQIWDDTLMMTIIPLIKIGLILNKKNYIDEGIYQFLIHTLYLMDKTSNLWFHGWSFIKSNNFSKVFWARGNCWIVIATIEIIDLLHLSLPKYIYNLLLNNLNNLLISLSKLQNNNNGLWHTILNDSTSYIEASASAGIVYGILKGIRKNYISNKYEKIALLALKGLLNLISKNGYLKQVSFGTAMGKYIDYYKSIPLTPMPYGQALLILALTEYMYYYI